MSALLFGGATESKPKLHLSFLGSRRSGETRIWRPGSTLFRFLGKLPVLAGLATVLLATTALATTPNCVQANSAVPQTPQSNVTVTYTAAQTVGNLNVVIVG
jgi:hypothetical protein